MRFFFCFLLTVLMANAQTLPKKLLIYYGYPSLLNGNAGNLTAIASELSQYDYVVLGAGLEKTTHADHAFTTNLLGSSQTSTVKFYGYIDLGISRPDGTTLSNHSQAEIELRIQEWKATGADGIFFDDVEYAYKVGRARQNAAVNFAHSQGLPVVMNGFNPDEIFGQQANPTYNPTGAATSLDTRDGYLSESFLISEGTYADAANWQPKATLLAQYQQQIGFRIWSITTNSAALATAPATTLLPLFHYAWYGAWLYGHEATGWGEYQFSACCGTDNTANFRPRPTPTNPGTAFTGPIRQTGNRLTRYTNTGQIWLETASHQAGFTPCDLCQSSGSGSWQNPSTWLLNRLPLACDVVDIQPGHVVLLNADSQAGLLRLRGKLQSGTYRLQLRVY